MLQQLNEQSIFNELSETSGVDETVNLPEPGELRWAVTSETDTEISQVQFVIRDGKICIYNKSKVSL